MRYTLLAVLLSLAAACGPQTGPACVEHTVVCIQETRALWVCNHGDWMRAYVVPCGDALHAETVVNACDIPVSYCPGPVDHGS